MPFQEIQISLPILTHLSIITSLEKKIEARTGEVVAAEARLADKERQIENLKRLLEQRYHSEYGNSSRGSGEINKHLHLRSLLKRCLQNLTIRSTLSQSLAYFVDSDFWRPYPFYPSTL